VPETSWSVAALSSVDRIDRLTLVLVTTGMCVILFVLLMLTIGGR
jgi:hypothetical protein